MKTPIYIPFDDQEPIVEDEHFLRREHDGVKDSNAVVCVKLDDRLVK